MISEQILKIKKSDIKPGTAKSYQIANVKIVVCNADGEYFALEDICSHDGGEIISGEKELTQNCQIECPRHGARFDVKTGQAKRMPAIAPLKTYNIRAIDNELEVRIQE